MNRWVVAMGMVSVVAGGCGDSSSEMNDEETNGTTGEEIGTDAGTSDAGDVLDGTDGTDDGDSSGSTGEACVPLPELCRGDDDDCDGLVDDADDDCAPGNPLWARRIGGPGHETLTGLVMAPDGGAIAVGQFTGEVDFGNGQQDDAVLTDPGDAQQTYAVRFDPHGDVETAIVAVADGGDFSQITGVTSDGADGFWLGGNADGSVVLGKGTASEQSLDAQGFLAHFDADLNVVAAFGVANVPRSLRPAASGGLYSYAEFGWTHFDSGGAVVASALYAIEEGAGTFVDVDDVVIDGDGVSTIAGRFVGEVTFASGTPQEVMFTTEDYLGFVARYDATGTLQWVSTLDDIFEGPHLAARDDGVIAIAGFTVAHHTGPDLPSPDNGVSGPEPSMLLYDASGTASVLPLLVPTPIMGEISWALDYHGIAAPGADDVAFSGTHRGNLRFATLESEVINTSVERVLYFARHDPSDDGALAWLTPAVAPRNTSQSGYSSRGFFDGDAMYFTGRFQQYEGRNSAVFGDHTLPASAADTFDVYVVRFNP